MTKIDISKELVEEIMDIKINGFYFDGMLQEPRFWVDDTQPIPIICWNELSYINEISINDLVFKAKEWAYSKGYSIISGRSYNGNYIANVMIKKGSKHFRSTSEQQAIIDACQFIYKRIQNEKAT